MNTKQSAVDLTDLAVGIIILGVVVTVGTMVIITQRDTRLTELDVVTTTNESIDTTTTGSDAFANKWFKELKSCINQSNNVPMAVGNVTVSTSAVDGTATATNASTTAAYKYAWNCTYTWYNTSRADYDVANDAAVGLGEYGSWFKILVIVGIAAVVLALIFMSFGKSSSGQSVSY